MRPESYVKFLLKIFLILLLVVVLFSLGPITNEGTIEALDQQVPLQLLLTENIPGQVELVISDRQVSASLLTRDSDPYKLGQVIYVALCGDTLTGVAKKFGSTVEALQVVNNIANPDLIYEGQQLIIPYGEEPLPDTLKITYIVQRGDTLAAVANRYRTPITRLIADNHIINPNLIYINQRLLLYPFLY